MKKYNCVSRLIRYNLWFEIPKTQTLTEALRTTRRAGSSRWEPSTSIKILRDKKKEKLDHYMKDKIKDIAVNKHHTAFIRGINNGIQSPAMCKGWIDGVRHPKARTQQKDLQ